MIRARRVQALAPSPVEDLPVEGTALEQAPLGRVELVEARGSAGPVGFEGQSPRPSSSSAIARISGMNGGYSPAAPAIVREFAGSATREQLVDLLVAQGPQPQRHRPRGRRSVSSGRAMQRRRSGAPRREERDVLDEVEEGLFGPVDVVEDDDGAAGRGAAVLERVAEGPGDLVRRRGRVGLAEQ